MERERQSSQTEENGDVKEEEEEGETIEVAPSRKRTRMEPKKQFSLLEKNSGVYSI